MPPIISGYPARGSSLRKSASSGRPPWWGWGGSGFVFTAGFWGPTVGFYGGINYGFGYFGHGYEGGRWEGGHFFYNTTINHVDVTVIHNVYNTRVVVRNDTHVSYNGHGGIDARATREEEAAEHERHVGPVAAQTEHIDAARRDPQQRFSANHGRPSVVATARPGEFKGGGEARPGEAGRPEGNAGRAAVHPNDLPKPERMAAPNTGDAKLDKKYQQQQEKLQAQQDKDRQKLQSQQDKEHQQAAKRQQDATRNQQMEQRHQQQTEQMQQRHTQQRQQLQQRQSAPRAAGRPRK